MAYSIFHAGELEWHPRREGDPRLVKITTASDLAFVETLLSHE